MRVTNIHKRKIDQPKEDVSKLFKTLATREDKIWPIEKWPAMYFKEGIKVGSKGGHGMIRYKVVSLKKGEHIKFEFTKPDGFYGTHELSIEGISDMTTEIIHEIKMNTSFKATFLWITMIKWLHDALIEDAFDKVENQFLAKNKVTKHNFWVRFLRQMYRRKSFKTKAILEKR